MSRSIAVSAALAVIGLVGMPALARAQKDSTLLRPTRVIVRIDKDPTTLYNGTYTAAGISTKCGLADFMMPHRKNSFAVIFPDDTATIAVRSVEFDADTLARGTTVTSFYLAVGVRVGATGTPPLYVVRANKPQFGEPGTASRSSPRKGVDSLQVDGTASLGSKVSVKMTLVCDP